MNTFLTPGSTLEIKTTHAGFDGSITIGPLDNFLRAYLDDNCQTDADGAFKHKHRRLMDIFSFSVKGWDLKDVNGEAIPFESTEVDIPFVGKRQKVTDAAMNRIKFNTIIEFGVRAITENYLSFDEKKT